MTRTALPITALAALVLVVASGCATGPQPTDSARPSTSAPSTTASATASADDDLLFTISGTLTSQEGSVVKVTETAYAPLADDAAAVALLRAQNCGEYLDKSSAPWFVRVETTAEVTKGPVPSSDDTLSLDIARDDARYYSPEAFTGDWRHSQAYCTDGYLAMPGKASGWVAYDGSDRWVNGVWGFSAGVDETTQPRNFAVSDCTVRFGSAASKESLPREWQAPVSTYGCFIGPQDN